MKHTRRLIRADCMRMFVARGRCKLVRSRRPNLHQYMCNPSGHSVLLCRRHGSAHPQTYKKGEEIPSRGATGHRPPPRQHPEHGGARPLWGLHLLLIPTLNSLPANCMSFLLVYHETKRKQKLVNTCRPCRVESDAV